MATLLNKEETNHFYKKINSISYHLANKTANMQKLKDDERKKAYFSIQRALRQAFLSYDRATKLATLNKEERLLDRYATMTNCPRTIFPDAPLVKGKSKKTAKKKAVKRI